MIRMWTLHVLKPSCRDRKQNWQALDVQIVLTPVVLLWRCAPCSRRVTRNSDTGWTKLQPSSTRAAQAQMHHSASQGLKGTLVDILDIKWHQDTSRHTQMSKSLWFIVYLRHNLWSMRGGISNEKTLNKNLWCRNEILRLMKCFLGNFTKALPNRSHKCFWTWVQKIRSTKIRRFNAISKQWTALRNKQSCKWGFS